MMADVSLGAWVFVALAGSAVFGWRLFARRGSIAERLFLAAAGGYLLLSHLGVLLAEAGFFGIRTLAIVTTASAIAVLLGLRQKQRGASRPNIDWAGIIAIPALLALTLWFSTPPFDTRLDARDQGVYRLTAAQLLRSGKLAFLDPLVRELPVEAREYFFRMRIESRPRSMGFYLDDPETGRVVPQFLPVAPVWLAIGSAGLGSPNASYANVGVAVLAAVALFLVARRLSNGLAGALAAAWLCMSFANSWFVRYGAAEVHAQAMILIGCYALLLERAGRGRALGLLAGWAFGLIWLTKLELAALVLPLATLYLADVLTGRLRVASTRWLWAGPFVLGAHAFAHLWFWSLPYVLDTLYGPPKTPFWMVTAVAGVAAAAALTLGVWSLRSSAIPVAWVVRSLDPASSPGRLFRAVLASIFVMAVYYSYFLRPAVPTWDSHNFLALVWLVSSVATLAAVAAVVLGLQWRSAPAGFGAVVTILLLASTVLLWRKIIIPELLWAYRRYLPVVLPATLMAAAGLLGLSAERAWLRLRMRPRRAMPSIAAALVITLVVPAAGWITWRSWAYGSRYAQVRDLRGSRRVIRTLAAALPLDAVVLVEPFTRRGLPRFENAIQHELGLGMLRLPEPEMDERVVLDVVRDQIARDRSVYLLTTGYLEAVDWLRAEPVKAFLWEGARLEETPQTGSRQPIEMEPVVINAKLYRLYPGAPVPLRGELDVGGWDDLYLAGRTLENIEGRRGERSFRWTHPVSRFILPGVEEATESFLITLASGYPPDLGEQRVTVRLDGLEMATVVVRRGFRDYSFPVPSEWAPTGEPAALEIETTPALNPADTEGSADRRTLGVAVDRIRWGPRSRP